MWIMAMVKIPMPSGAFWLEKNNMPVFRDHLYPMKHRDLEENAHGPGLRAQIFPPAPVAKILGHGLPLAPISRIRTFPEQRQTTNKDNG